MKRRATAASPRGRDGSRRSLEDGELRATMQSLPGAVYRCTAGPSPRMIEVSDGILTFTGRTAAEWIQGDESPADRVHHERFDIVSEGLQDKGVDLTLHNGGQPVFGSGSHRDRRRRRRDGRLDCLFREEDLLLFQMAKRIKLGYP